MGKEDITVFLNALSDRQASIVIKDKQYMISTHFSLYDMEKYMDNLKSSNNAKVAIATIIHLKMQKCDLSIPTLEEISSEDDSVFIDYIMKLVDDSKELKKYFELTEEALPITERFRLTNNEYYKAWKNSMAKITKPMMKNFEQINRINQSWINPMEQIINSFQPITDAILNITQMPQRIAEIVAPIQDALTRFTNLFTEIVSSIQIPTFSEEEKQQLLESYKTWGMYGWTVIPNASFDLFYSKPNNKEEADKIALSHCSKKKIEDLFTELRQKKIKKEDLDSAIFCYENRQYKACALLLFGIIDAKVIRRQPKIETQKRRRPTGKGAIARIEKHFNQHENEEYFLFSILHYTCLFESLNIMFADGNDFKQEPIVINRNYINHGMNIRSARKKDCIQMFLILYNFLIFFEETWD